MKEKEKAYTATALMKRFAPYFKPYKGTLFMDLFCAVLSPEDRAAAYNLCHLICLWKKHSA